MENEIKRDMQTRYTTTKIAALAIGVITLGAFAGPAGAEEQPHCHVYLPENGWTADVRARVRARYSSTNLCETQLKGYPCYRYFENREACKTGDETLVDLFLKDAERDGVIVP